MTVWRIYKRNICLPLLAISANCLFTEFFVFSASSGAYLLVRQQSIRINLCLLNPNSIHLEIYMQEWKGVFMDMLSCQKKDQNQIGKNIFFLKNLPFTKHSDIGKTFPQDRVSKHQRTRYSIILYMYLTIVYLSNINPFIDMSTRTSFRECEYIFTKDVHSCAFCEKRDKNVRQHKR